jgi:hypothetical protein
LVNVFFDDFINSILNGSNYRYTSENVGRKELPILALRISVNVITQMQSSESHQRHHRTNAIFYSQTDKEWHIIGQTNK